MWGIWATASIVGIAASSSLAAACVVDPAAPAPDAGPAIVDAATSDGARDAAPAPPVPDRAVACVTQISGKVLDPSGTLPLLGAVVYVPATYASDAAALPPFRDGVAQSCDLCDAVVTNPVAYAATDASGSFVLAENVPAEVPLTIVVQHGKWRRELRVPPVAPCTTLALDPEATRLPRTRAEGHIPRIAVATGGHDRLECLLHKLGIDPSEVGVAGSDARVHLYAGGGTDTGAATTALADGTRLPDASGLLADRARLRGYDIVALACEGAEHAETKPVAARDALLAYVAEGGRVLATHRQHTWLSAATAPEVRALATWANDGTCSSGCATYPEPPESMVVAATPSRASRRAEALAGWLAGAGALSPDGTLPVEHLHHTVDAVSTRAESWMTAKNAAAGDRVAHVYVTAGLPAAEPDELVCGGRITYASTHAVVGGSAAPYPLGCGAAWAPQEKASAILLFSILGGLCIQRDLPAAGPR